jgi:uncharacterized repeat protein (TIGR02543 family)
MERAADTTYTRRRRRGRYRLRKRRIVIPCVFTVALLITGQIYQTYWKAPDSGGASQAGTAVAADATGAAASGGVEAAAPATPEAVTLVFYAGDEGTEELRVTGNSKGGYSGIPVASRDGYDFAGWYTSRTGGERLSRKDSPIMSDGDTVYARWTKTDSGVDESVPGLPVLMYHWFYDTEQGDPEPKTLLNNWMKVSEFDKEVGGLVDAGYYFPSWDEVYAYVRGEIDLPAKSVVITIDDGHKSFYKYAAPILEKHGARGTGFIIANKVSKKKVAKYASDFVSLQSHTYAMHDGYGGDGLIETLPFEDAVRDLVSGAAILGTHDALAYPFGYYDDEAVSVVSAAGIRMAFGVSGGKVYPGMDPLRLPRVRINSDRSADAFLAAYT